MKKNFINHILLYYTHVKRMSVYLHRPCPCNLLLTVRNRVMFVGKVNLISQQTPCTGQNRLLRLISEELLKRCLLSICKLKEDKAKI